MSDDFDKKLNYLIPLKYKSHKENIDKHIPDLSVTDGTIDLSIKFYCLLQLLKSKGIVNDKEIEDLYSKLNVEI